METGQGAGPDHLTHYERLLSDPRTHHFFMALRLIEAQFAEAPRLGESRRPRDDVIRITQEAELAFPTSTIESITPPEGNRPGRVVNRFFGLFGPMGPLPLHLTEFARERVRNYRDTTFVAFADMLTHRLAGLLYRAWANSQPAPSFDRAIRGYRAHGVEADPFERKVGAFSGNYMDGTRHRDAMPELAKRHFAGHLSSGPRHAEGLTSILSAFVRAPVSLIPFVGEWLELEPDDRWQLGARAGLGQGTSVGSRVWSHAAKFRLRMGPMPLAEYRRLMPGTPSLERLEAIVRNYVGDTLDWDINLVVLREQVPQARLGVDTQLGQTSWIGTRDQDTDADDLYIIPQSLSHLRRAA